MKKSENNFSIYEIQNIKKEWERKNNILYKLHTKIQSNDNCSIHSILNSTISFR